MKVKILSSALAADFEQQVGDVVTVGDKQGIELVEVGAVEPTDKTEYDMAFKKYGSQRHHKIEKRQAMFKTNNVCENINNDKSVNAYIPAGVPRDTQILINRLREAGLPTRRFLKVGEDKAAFEDAFQEHLYDVEDLTSYPRWGIIGGHGGLVLLDADNASLEGRLRSALPPTFEVLTPTRKLSHFYIIVTGDKKVPSKKLFLPDSIKSCGELRVDQYLVAPGTTISTGMYRVRQDRPIAKMSFEDFENAIRPFLPSGPDQVAGDLKPIENREPLSRDLPCWEEISKGNIPVGSRHDLLGAYSRHLRYQGLTLEGALAILEKLHKRIPQPAGNVKEWSEIKRTCEQMYKRQYNVGCGTILKFCPELCIGPDCPVQLAKAKKKERKEEITDKDITDRILAEHEFFCDAENPDLPLYAWDGRVWSNSASEAIIKRETSEILKDEENRAQMVGLRAVEFIKGQSMSKKLTRKPSEIVAFQNRMFNVKTGEMVAHDSKYFYTNLIPHDHNPDAKCDKFLKWINEILHTEDIAFLQEWMGNCLFDRIVEPAFLFALGGGQNAKSCLFELLAEILGEKNISTVSLIAMTVDVFERSDIENKLAIIGDDIGDTEISNASAIKSISAGSLITVQRKYGHPHGIKPFCKPMYSCNMPPSIEQTDAVKMRLKTLDFPYTFVKTPNLEKGEKQARDKDELMAELKAEISGILNWMLEGLKRLINNKFKFSTSRSTDETWAFYQRKAAPALCYIEDRWEFTENEDDLIERGAAYVDFQKWIEEKNLKIKVKRKKFYGDLKDEGYEQPQIGPRGGIRCFRGVKLRGATTPADDVVKKDILKLLTFGPQTEEELENQLKTADPAKVKEAAEELFKKEQIAKKSIGGCWKWGLIAQFITE